MYNATASYLIEYPGYLVVIVAAGGTVLGRCGVVYKAMPDRAAIKAADIIATKYGYTLVHCAEIKVNSK